jgi:SAM-dependent methyltransferase
MPKPLHNSAAAKTPAPRQASRYPYHQVLALVDEFQPKTVLEVGAGNGALALQLLQRGLQVEACDIKPGPSELPGISIRAVDLNVVPLPYADEAFDLITCCHVIEHLENPHSLIRECHRLLRPGGRAIIALPNILNIQNRFRTFFSGITPTYRALGRLGPIAEVAGSNINPIPIHELIWLGAAYGLPVELIAADYIPFKMRLLAPAAALIKLFTCIAGAKSRRYYHLSYANSQPVLFGRGLVLSLVKHAALPPIRIIPAKGRWP